MTKKLIALSVPQSQKLRKFKFPNVVSAHLHTTRGYANANAKTAKTRNGYNVNANNEIYVLSPLREDGKSQKRMLSVQNIESR